MKITTEIDKIKFETKEENIFRPSSWDEYFGQEDIKKNLNIFIQASLKREEPIDHILIFGPPGLGKTSIANIIVKKMNSNIHTTSAPMISKTGDLAALLTNLQDGDTLFIDEIHRMSSAIEEILYSAMEDFRLDIIIGSGPSAQTIKIDLPRFTLIGATTRIGMLSNPLRDRFGINLKMQFYSIEELSEIIISTSVKLNKQIDKNSSLEIAKRGRRTPRIAIKLLKRVIDFAEVKNSSVINLKITKYALNAIGINNIGFTKEDVEYIQLLISKKNKAVGLNTIAAILNEDINTITDVIEPYLITQGFIEKTNKGRVATKKSYDYFIFKETI